MEIDSLILLILCNVGILFLISGILIIISSNKKRKRCTEETKGVIIKHSYRNQAFAPIAEYCIDHKVYKLKRKFRGVVRTRKFGVGYENKSAYVSDKDFLYIQETPVSSLRSMAEELYPLNSQLTVYYNPSKPQEAFLEKIPQKASVVGVVFCWTGMGLIVLGILMNLLL